MPTIHTLTGTLISKATPPESVGGLRIELLDSQSIFTGLVGLGESDADGGFVIRLTDEDVAAMFGERPPEVYLRVIQNDRDVLADTAGKQTWRIDGRTTTVQLPVNGAIGTIEDLEQLQVRGHVYHTTDGPISGVTVKAYDVNVGAEQLLGQATTDSRGAYSIVFDQGDLFSGKHLADLRMKAEVGGTPFIISDIRCQAPPSVVIDLIDGGTEYRGPTERTTVLAAVGAALGGGDPASLTDDEVEQLACSANRGIDEVRTLRGAALLKNDSDFSDVSEDALYGLLRQRVPEAKRDLLALPAPQLTSALGAAVAANQVGLSTDEVDAEVAGLVLAQVRLAVDITPDPGTICNLGDVLKIFLDDAHARAFVERYSRRESTLESFCDDLTLVPTDFSGPVVWLRTDKNVYEDLNHKQRS
jgi:hypothetical protein